jgi:hypothetical protein
MKMFLALDLATKNAYSAMLIPMDAQAKALFTTSPDQAYAMFAVGMAGVSGQKIEGKPFTLGNVKGQEFGGFTEPKSGKRVFMRVFTVNDNIAAVFALADQSTPLVQAFLDSIRTGK